MRTTAVGGERGPLPGDRRLLAGRLRFCALTITRVDLGIETRSPWQQGERPLQVVEELVAREHGGEAGEAAS